MGQAAWSVDTNGDYTVLGGEFPRVNGTDQQGLVRFAKRAISPLVDAIQKYTELTPTLTPLGAGTVRVGWKAAWDRDNAQLKFEVLRGADHRDLDGAQDLHDRHDLVEPPAARLRRHHRGSGLEPDLPDPHDGPDRQHPGRSARHGDDPAATSNKEIIEKRGHKVGKISEFPIIVSNDLEKITKTSRSLRKTLLSLGQKRTLQDLQILLEYHPASHDYEEGRSTQLELSDSCIKKFSNQFS